MRRRHGGRQHLRADRRAVHPIDRPCPTQLPDEEWAPFNYQEGGNVTGISVDILEVVFEKVGVNRTRADVRIVPLAEGFQAAQKNTSTVLFAIVRKPEREPLYKWAGPFTRARFVLFAPMSRNIAIASPEDLNRYRIGAVNDSIENDLLTGLGVNASRLVPGQTPKTSSGCWRRGGSTCGQPGISPGGIRCYGLEWIRCLRGRLHPERERFYYIFSKDVPDTLVNTFQQALNLVRNQKDEQGVSEYERIIYRYLGVGCVRRHLPMKR